MSGAAAQELCRLSASLFARGMAGGGAGNISVRTDDGYLVTPTGSSLGALTPERFVSKPPEPPRIPTAVWINPPKPTEGNHA